jgi:hypothetical protein
MSASESCSELIAGEAQSMLLCSHLWAIKTHVEKTYQDLSPLGNYHYRVQAEFDWWLQVLGAPGVYAMGDCATIATNSLTKDMEKLYKEAQQLEPHSKGLTPQAFLKFIEVTLLCIVEVKIKIKIFTNDARLIRIQLLAV